MAAELEFRGLFRPQAMRQLADELAKRPALANVRLLTITFDPETDTPGVLRTYAQGYGIDFKRHSFLTGREAAKHMLPRGTRHNVLLLVEELLHLHVPTLFEGALNIDIEYSEKNGDVELSFASPAGVGNVLEAGNHVDELPLLLIRNFGQNITYAAADGLGRLSMSVRPG